MRICCKKSPFLESRKLGKQDKLVVERVFLQQKNGWRVVGKCFKFFGKMGLIVVPALIGDVGPGRRLFTMH